MKNIHYIFILMSYNFIVTNNFVESVCPRTTNWRGCNRAIQSLHWHRTFTHQKRREQRDSCFHGASQYGKIACNNLLQCCLPLYELLLLL